MAVSDAAKIQLPVGPPIDRHICLENLLIEQRKNVLFVGEGNFTFTLAFAALRKYCWYSNPVKLDDWQGIVSSRLEHSSEMTESSHAVLFKNNLIEIGIDNEYLDPPDPEVIRQTCLDNIRGKIPKSLLLKDHPNPQEIIESIPPGEFYCGIDALDIPLHLIPHRGVIWFQCPWVPRPGSVCDLISGFLLNTAPKLVHEDSYVCIGITKHPAYFKDYQLQSILRACSNTENYEFLGADDDLIYQILGFGYRHQSLSERDIHNYICDDHITLIFKRILRKPACRMEF